MKGSRFFVCAALVMSLSLLGCGPAAPKELKRYRVSGKVTLDSKPLTTGNITFDPGSGEVPASLDILDGNYEGKAPVGKSTVRITATRKISMKQKMGFDGPGYDQLVDENLLPARYHNDSKITREVEANDDNNFNFDLSSK